MTRLVCLVTAVCCVFGGSPAVQAQVLETAATPAPAPAPGPVPPECYPACRSGFLCHNGACVSACNPPCEAGAQCRGGECVAAAAARPEYQEEPSAAGPAPGAEQHDGFMLRLTLGFGYSSTKLTAKGDDDEVAIYGFSGSFSIDLGGAIAENLVLHARLSDLVVLSPKASVNGTETGGVDQLTLGGLFFGPGITYYIMPANLYLSLTLGISWLTRDNAQTEPNSSDVGFGANADLGKEWWVSDNWGLGLAARFWFTRAGDSDDNLEITYTMLGFAVVFSATYN